MSLENKYFAELARRLRAAGITAGHPEKNRLTVLLNNQPVLSVSAGSDVFLLPAGSNQPEAGELYHKVAQTADEVYAYIRRSAAPKHQPDKNLSELPTTGDYAIRIKLASRSNMEGVWIGFPDAGEYTDPHYPDELLLGMDAMQAESLNECIALEVDCCLPQLMDILSQYDSASELVRHAIDFGYVWAEQGQGEAYWMDKWQAVLELEDCHRLDQALDFSQNLQHFAFIPRGVELGRFGFELAVKSGIIDRDSFLSKCFDGKSYAEWYIQKHGLSATDHGYVAWNGGELRYEYPQKAGIPDHSGDAQGRKRVHLPIRYEADQIKQRQKEEQAQRGAGPVME